MLWLRPTSAPIIDKVVLTAGKGMWFSQKNKAEKIVMGHQNPIEYLQRVNEDAWSRLFDYTKKNPVTQVELPLLAGALPYRISTRRQVLLATDQDFIQAKAFVDYFGIRTGIMVIPAAGAQTALRLAELHRLSAATTGSQGDDLDITLRIDPFKDRIDEGPVHRRDYCVMTLERNNELLLRSSLDFAVAFIAFGLRQHFKGEMLESAA